MERLPTGSALDELLQERYSMDTAGKCYTKILEIQPQKTNGVVNDLCVGILHCFLVSLCNICRLFCQIGLVFEVCLSYSFRSSDHSWITSSKLGK